MAHFQITAVYNAAVAADRHNLNLTHLWLKRCRRTAVKAVGNRAKHTTHTNRCKKKIANDKCAGALHNETPATDLRSASWMKAEKTSANLRKVCKRVLFANVRNTTSDVHTWRNTRGNASTNRKTQKMTQSVIFFDTQQTPKTHKLKSRWSHPGLQRGKLSLNVYQ